MKIRIIFAAAFTLSGCIPMVVEPDVREGVDVIADSVVADHPDIAAPTDSPAADSAHLDAGDSSTADASPLTCTVTASGDCVSDPPGGDCCAEQAWIVDLDRMCRNPAGGSHMTFLCVDTLHYGCGGGTAVQCFTRSLPDGGTQILITPGQLQPGVIADYGLQACSGNPPYSSWPFCP